MSLLIVIGILLIYGIKWLYDILTANRTAYDRETIQKMNREMVGKSKSECRDILDKYGK